jgi:hypothetical protein
MERRECCHLQMQVLSLYKPVIDAGTRECRKRPDCVGAEQGPEKVVGLVTLFRANVGLAEINERPSRGYGFTSKRKLRVIEAIYEVYGRAVARAIYGSRRW